MITLFLFIIFLLFPQFAHAAPLTNTSTTLKDNGLRIETTTANTIPAGGNILITIPPEANFDIGELTITDVTISGCGDSQWHVKEIVSREGDDNHTIEIERRQTDCPAPSNIVINIDNVSSIEERQTIYPLRVETKDKNNVRIDEINMKVAPPIGVSLSATVAESPFEEYRFTLFGYTSPEAKVRIEGLNLADETLADGNGYFIFNRDFSLFSSYQEACLSAQDTLGRTSLPFCLPRFPNLSGIKIGPVIMPPTVSVDKSEYFIGDEAILSGMTIPGKEITFFFFKDEKKSVVSFLENRSLIKPVYALTFPQLTTRADREGNFSISIPTNNPSFLRVFAQTDYENSPSPNSLTLHVRVLPWWMIIWNFFLLILLFLKGRLLELVIFTALLAILIALIEYFFHPHRLAKTRAITIREKHPLATTT